MTSRGSESSRGTSSSRGRVNMWCIGSMRPSSSFHSRSGKSVTQHMPSTSGSASPRRSLKWSRRRLRPSNTTGFLSATKNIQSPSAAPSVARRASCCSGEKNFATGLLRPSGCTWKWARPLAPPEVATAVSSSISLRVRSPSPPTAMPRTEPPESTAPLKTLNSASATSGETSCVGELLDDTSVETLDEVEDFILRRVAHLEVELGVLGLAVAALVLVAQGAGYLEVAFETGHHQQLLELLGDWGSA